MRVRIDVIARRWFHQVLGARNDGAKPFMSATSAEEILDSLARCCGAVLDAHRGGDEWTAYVWDGGPTGGGGPSVPKRGMG